MYDKESKCHYEVWYREGALHREDGPAIEWRDGTKEWYVNNERHRVDGPAFVRWDGYKAWFLNDKIHRTDGPAAEWPDGRKEWWVNGEKKTEEEFNDLYPKRTVAALRSVSRIVANMLHLRNKDSTPADTKKPSA